MNVLDENIPPSERQILKSWRMSVRHIGYGVGQKGMQDEQIVPYLLRLRRPTFFTLDGDSYRRDLCHARYGLVFLDVDQYEAAIFIRRFLRHKEFNIESKRMGKVIRVSHANLAVWSLFATSEIHFDWLG